MANPEDRASVEDAFVRLERGGRRPYVVEVSPLGLVEMTRQNVTDGPREILTPLPRLRRRRVRRLGRDGGDRDRAPAPQARGGRPSPGVPRRRPSPRAPLLAVRGGGAWQRSRRVADDASSPFRRAENGHVHLDHFEVQDKAGSMRSSRPHRSRKKPARVKLVKVGLTTRPLASARSTAPTSSLHEPQSSSARR